MEITLNWEGPFTFKDLISEKKKYDEYDEYNCPGIYLWMENWKEKGWRFPIYIGKSTNLSSRHLDHYTSYLGGLSFIPKRRIEGSKFDWECKIKKRSDKQKFDEQRDEFVETIFNKDKFCGFISEVFKYTESLEIYLAKSEHFKPSESLEKYLAEFEDKEKELIRITEAKLLYDLGNELKVKVNDLTMFQAIKGTKTKPAKEIEISHAGKLTNEDFASTKIEEYKNILKQWQKESS